MQSQHSYCMHLYSFKDVFVEYHTAIPKIIGTVGSKVRLADKSEFVNPASDIGNTPFNVDMDTILDELKILVVESC